jgi:hypothetical protein
MFHFLERRNAGLIDHRACRTSAAQRKGGASQGRRGGSLRRGFAIEKLLGKSPGCRIIVFAKVVAR